MNRIPFKKFIIAFLLFNKSIPFIIEKLKEFGYFITEEETKKIFDGLREILPSNIVEVINAGTPLNINDEEHVKWLNELGVFELYDYMARKDIVKENEPEYFRRIANCLWIQSYEEIMLLVNILLFNQEGFEEIIDIIRFKCKRMLDVKTLELYFRLFWDTTDLTTKDILYYCVPFRNNDLIIQKFKFKGLPDDSSNDGSDVPITFHDTNYIKWKIGYNNKTPTPTMKEFLERVKKDSYYKYYESMNMAQSIESEIEEGSNDKFGSFNSTKILKRNVEEQRTKLTKHWMDVYLKAAQAIPEPKESDVDFFEKMRNLELEFDAEEKIIPAKDNPDIINDIKGDISA